MPLLPPLTTTPCCRCRRNPAPATGHGTSPAAAAVPSQQQQRSPRRPGGAQDRTPRRPAGQPHLLLRRPPPLRFPAHSASATAWPRQSPSRARVAASGRGSSGLIYGGRREYCARPPLHVSVPSADRIHPLRRSALPASPPGLPLAPSSTPAHLWFCASLLCSLCRRTLRWIKSNLSTTTTVYGGNCILFLRCRRPVIIVLVLVGWRALSSVTTLKSESLMPVSNAVRSSIDY